MNRKSTDIRQDPVRNKFLTGFTLMEVVVGLIIFSIAFGGLIAAFVGVRRYVSRATKRVTTTNLDRRILNSLHKDVRADTWDNGTLSTGGTYNVSSVFIDNFEYGTVNSNYTVKNVTDGNITRDYRQVDVTISYPVN